MKSQNLYLNRANYSAPEMDFTEVSAERGFAQSGYGENGKAGRDLDTYDIFNNLND